MSRQQSDEAGDHAAREAIRHWPEPAQLLQFALARHGYLDTNGFFGITYPSDLDDCDRARGEQIPEGMIEVVAGYGDARAAGHLLPESRYIELLAEFLAERGADEQLAALERAFRERRGTDMS